MLHRSAPLILSAIDHHAPFSVARVDSNSSARSPAPPPPPREEGGVRPAARTAGDGPRVCAGTCCLGLDVPPGTRRCTKPRCLSRCHSAPLCRHSNRCVCPRCDSSPVMGGAPHTGVHGTARSGPGASDPNPPQTFNVQEDGKTLNTGEEKGDSSATSPQPGRRAERTETQESNNLQEKEKQIKAGLKTDPPPSQTLFLNRRQTSPPEDQGVFRKETSASAGVPNPESKSRTGGQRSENVAGTPEKKKKETRGADTQSLSLREAQAIMLRKTVSLRGRGDKMATLLMKHIEKERKKVLTMTSSPDSSSPSSSSASSIGGTGVKTFYTQKGRYSLHVAAAGADGQTVSGGRGVERLQVMFTPTVCKVRCSQDRCVNYCEHGNVTTLYSGIEGGAGGGRGPGGGRRDGSHGPGFRVFLCPLLCKNGGVCLQKDRCLCPPGFSGKFCQVPIASSASFSTNDIVKSPLLSAMEAIPELTQSEFLLPLRSSKETRVSGAPGPSMVQVRVHHPPQTSTILHQVQKVSRSSPALQTLSSSSGSAGAPAPAGVQAQTVRGGGPIGQQAGFKYCFREVKEGQCSSPLPGLRSRDICCQGIGKAWGTTECVLCPDTTGQSNSSCPAGFQRANGTQCVDVNECLQPGLCENGICVNTRGRYSCVCRAGFILDASHGICISQSVISEERGQCHRVLGSGRGPTSCSLPILRSITKQICCCSRVGRAWGPDCQRCPHFGTVAFKETCPAGPGYHYSASALQFNQRAAEQLGTRGAPLVNPGPGSGSSRSHQRPSSSEATADKTKTSSGGTSRPGPAPSQPPRQADSTSTATANKAQSADGPLTQNRLPPAGPFTPEPAPRPPSGGSQGGGRSSSVSREDPLPPPARALSPERPTTTPQARVQMLRGVCERRPGVCGPGVCVQQPGGTHTCVCNEGHQLDSQRTFCRDVNECVRSAGVCAGGECVNTLGSFKCVCSSGYKSNSQQTGCQDVDECEDALQCPGQQCINTQGSYRCVSCRHGYGLLNGVCTDVDECRQSPCSSGRCENTPGSYHCICRHGYRLQNNTCTDVDECAEPSQCPGQMCVNSVGSYRCTSCGPGHTLTNRQCTDVDECVAVGVCEAERVCVNTVGSFRCDCASGYQTSGPGRKCRDVNECLQEDLCSTGVCVNSLGSFSCLCPQGFSPSDNSTSCTDVDECVESGLCVDGRCVNTEGSFQCQCGTGFTSNPEGTACLDLDECVQSGGSVCVMSQRCENTIGSYHCITSCQPGYQVTRGGSCEDLNECSNQTVCGQHALCQNLVGTFLCVCDQGFTSADGGGTCEDEDECVSRPGLCGSARCENVEGSFLCECDQRGHEFHTGSRRCVNTDQQAERLSGSSSFHLSVLGAPPLLPPLPAARPGELRECYYNLAEAGTCSLLATNTSQQECCCTVGEGWGLGCQYHGCPPTDSVHFLSLCPSGTGYVTTGPGAFSYTDVDECKRFHPEVCKNGVCVNNIPGYNCYCPSGYVYNSTLLECVDHDECEEESCVGGACVNTVGSYYCSCAPPLQLDDTQRHCVNSSHLPGDENLSLCWQHVTADLVCQSPLLGAQVTFMDCCCLYGEGWGMECALCPPTDSDDYASLCTSLLPPLFPGSFSDSGPEPGVRPGGRGGVRESSPPYFPPYSPDSFPPAVAPDYEDYSPAGGSRGRTPVSLGLPEGAYQGPEFSTGFYTEGDFLPPDGSLPRPQAERAFGARPPPSRPDGPPISLAPLPGAPYRVEQEEEGGWRQPLPFPPFTERRGGAAPRRLYERRYESYAGLSAAEDCGILHGCENGRCIRVAEGYTCDCYQGYGLDMTSMTCADLNECEASVLPDFPCVNARCVNTAGSFRCVCRRGYVMSRRPNHCVAA
ncbi:latent-transforming growth factor beta-binding protein 4-like isoform 2-T2 [Spinachia spinachia]